MDEMLARLNRIYPNSGFVKIAAYNAKLFEDKDYDSAFDTKAAMNRWSTKPLTYEEAQEWVEEGNRIGWVIPQGYVVVDVDNVDDKRSQDYLERLLTKFEVCYSYNYTSKGIHILLRDSTQQIKSDAHMKCALNIMIDTRANKTGYIVLPCNDPHREWGKWQDTVEEIPYFLKPILKDNTPSFIGMVDGDGRNDALFKWRTQLEKTNKLTKSEIEKSLRIINENLFDIPMTNAEMYKTVLRDTKTEKVQKQARGSAAYNELADTLLLKTDLISYGDTFYKFNGVYYREIERIDIERMIHYELSTDLGTSARTEIINFLLLKTQVTLDSFNKEWNKIAVQNGILNLLTGEIEEPNKAEINTISIPWAYNNDPPYSSRIDTFMKELTNGDITKMEFLYQVAGYCLLKKNLFEKFFVFQGEGGTGKSTFTNLLQKLVGGDVNCSHVGLDNMDKDYYLSTMVGKLLNIDDDAVDGKVLESTGRFKSIVSGNKVSVRQIFRPVIQFVPYATLVFSCNRLPRVMDKTSGLERRLILIELNHKIQKPDPLFMNRITDLDMEYFLFKAVEGIKLALEEGQFRISVSDAHLLNTFKRKQSSIGDWIYDADIRAGDINGTKCATLYAMFSDWATINGYKNRPTSYTFREDICAMYKAEICSSAPEPGKLPTLIFNIKNCDKDYRPF